jgi:replication factor A2
MYCLGMDYQSGGGGGGGFNSGGGGSGGRGGRPSSGYSSQSGDRGGSGGGARKSYDEQTMIPITIGMALASQPDESAEGSGDQQLADGRKLNHVRIVAATRTVDDLSTTCIYTMEDGTGSIEVKQWVINDPCSAAVEAKRETLQEGKYLKITGQIKDTFDGKKMIVADSIRPLHTGNELAHHMLEVVYAEQMAQRKQHSFGAAHNNMMMGGTGVGFGGGGGMETPAHHRRAQQPLQQQSHGGGGAGGGFGDDGGLRDKVLDFIKTHENLNDQGANITECARNLQSSSGFSEASVRKVVDELSAEGLIYSSVDEDHYMFAS